MTSQRITRVWGIILLTITIFSLSIPVYAKYSGGTGEPNFPYQIAPAENLMLLRVSPEDYDKQFILTIEIDPARNRNCNVLMLDLVSVDLRRMITTYSV